MDAQREKQEEGAAASKVRRDFKANFLLPLVCPPHLTFPW